MAAVGKSVCTKGGGTAAGWCVVVVETYQARALRQEWDEAGRRWGKGTRLLSLGVL
jgi:hypothetical protein